jgi:ankyrin repeat protein
MKHLLLTTIAALVLVGCGESQPPTTDYVDPRVADYDPNESWGLSEEEKAAEEAAKKPQPEPPTAKASDISIHQAAEDGNIEAVKQHLAAGADVNAKDGWGYTPLHNAADGGHMEITELLIDKGAEVNAKEEDTGKTPLHYAHNKEIAELLISKGADVNAKDKFEQTTLHSAASEGHNETAELLIAKGVDVNAKNDDGKTSLDWATHPDNPDASAELANLLRKHGGKTGEELKAEGK